MAAAFRPCTSLLIVFSVLRLSSGRKFPYIYSSKVTLISVQMMIIRSIIIRPPHHLAFFRAGHQNLRDQGIKGRKNHHGANYGRGVQVEVSGGKELELTQVMTR